MSETWGGEGLISTVRVVFCAMNLRVPPPLLRAAMLLVGTLLVQIGLRPDPLLLARSLHVPVEAGPGRRRGVLGGALAVAEPRIASASTVLPIGRCIASLT